MKYFIELFKQFILSLLLKLKIYLLNKELNKQRQITKDKVNEANTMADNFLSNYDSYIQQRTNQLRPVIDSMRSDRKDSKGSNNGTTKTD